MELGNKKNGNKIPLNFNHVIYLCVVLACLVPRYISTFKLHVGLNISYYTIFVVAIWLLYVRKIKVVKRLECSFFFIWLAFIALSVWRAEKIGVWGYYLDWILTAVLFQQIMLYKRDENTYEYIVKALTDALFIHLLMGLYEITAHRYLFETGNIARRLYGHVAIGIFHNLNDYATFVTTMIPFAIYRLMKNKLKIERIYCAFLIFASLYFIIISESRGAILTLLVFICGGLIMFARKNTRNTLITAAGLAMFAFALISNVGGYEQPSHTYLPATQ